jgi:hypothetical protein
VPFQHDVAGGQGSLVITSLKSPNFVHGSTGWAINKDGSAEFHTVSLPAGSGGAVVTFASTAPASPNVGDVWYDTSNGMLGHQWNGSAWTAYQIGTSAIGSGAVTAAKLAAGIVVAGIVDATTITGATINGGTFNGTNWIENSNGTVGYSGTPAANNMLYSDAPAAFTDAYGNKVLSGRAVYSGNFAFVMNPSSTNLLTFTNSSNQSGTWTAQGTFQLSADSTGQTPSQLQPGSIVFQNTGVPLVTNISAGFSALYCSTAGKLGELKKTGLGGYWPIDQVDTSTNTNANGAGATKISAIWTIPANDAQAGTVYELEVPFSARMESQTLQLGLSIDGATSFAVLETIGGAIVSAGTGLLGNIRIRLQILTTGTSGTYNAFVDGVVGQSGANSLFTNRGSLVRQVLSGSINTTVNHTFRINSLWGASNASQTVSGYGSKFTRSGP